MDPVFNEIHTKPENEIFKVVFFPDRIYHEQYLNATRSSRYRYNVREVRNKHDITILKGEVYLDNLVLSNFIRIEYRASRLVETARTKDRSLQENVGCYIKLLPEDESLNAEATIQLTFSKMIDAFQGEIWQTLQAPAGHTHDYKVLSLMGKGGCITKIPDFENALNDIKKLKALEIAFREPDIDFPFGYKISSPTWDNNYLRSYQVPNTPNPSDPANTVETKNYYINFQKGWYLDVNDIEPVRYRNAMMDDKNSELGGNNFVDMKWIVQRELGGNIVYFHEVTIEQGNVEGTHRHIGSEELYYIVEGEGIAYMGVGDDPATDAFPTVERDIYMIGKRACKELPVSAGKVIYTKSGGIHGIRNTGTKPLKFVAFGYQGA